MAEIIGQGTQMGLRILKLHCFENNVPAIRMYHAFGFTECGLFPDAFVYRGSFVSELTLYKKLYPI
jgi:RimJ/RimL family protein N-acetyltransferase